MPRKDREAQKAYQREWYSREENRRRTVEKVKARKWTVYGGTCKNCGAPTMGMSKGQAAEFCGKPACKSVQHKLNREVFIAAGRIGRERQIGVTRYAKRYAIRQKKVVTLEELADAY